LEERLGELHTGFEQQHDVARKRTDEIARQLESLAAENLPDAFATRTSLSEVRSLLAGMNAGVPQERLDSLLNSSRAQILSDPEWRLSEVFGHVEQLVGQASNRGDELGQRVEKPSTETRDYLAEIRSLIDRASREIRPQDLTAIEQSVGQATKEFENAAARVSDRQLVRLMEQKQAVSQEVSLELEARACEAHALLQKAANSTLEEFRRRVEVHIDLILADAIERASSSLALSMPKAAPPLRRAAALWKPMSPMLASSPPWNFAPASKPSSIPVLWPLLAPSINIHRPLSRDFPPIPAACHKHSTPSAAPPQGLTILPRNPTTPPVPDSSRSSPAFLARI